MRQKMARHFCQWDSGEKLVRNNTSPELKFFDEPFRKYLSLKISNLNIKNILPLKNFWRTLEDVKSNFGQL